MAPVDGDSISSAGHDRRDSRIFQGRKTPSKCVRRLFVRMLGVLVLLLAAGAGYEKICVWRAWRDFPPPGKLVDVGGRRIQIDCRGIGAPVVVFEAGLDINGALSWSAVHAGVAQTTRACAYSRAGILWSDPRQGPSHSVNIAEDLHTLLINAGEKPPFVLVGHSLGGLYIVNYTTRFPSDVAGLVLVDAAHPEQVERSSNLVPNLVDPTTPASYRLKVAFAWTGIMRTNRESSIGVPHQPLRDVQAAAAYAPSSVAAMLKEEDSMREALAEAGASHALGDRPTLVLTGVGPIPNDMLLALNLSREQGTALQDMWKRMQDDEASWSSRSQQQIIADTGHYIQFDRPDAVIATVRSVVASVREFRGKR
jgi:pimeloyl-ACP methyl ester carboxylesterase